MIQLRDSSGAQAAPPRERRARGGVTDASIDPARIALLTGRVPMFPARVARELFAAPDPLRATRELLETSPLFDAAVFLASKSLHEALGPWRAGEEPKKKRAPLKALSYALRMSTRSTPFGLFAGTGVVARGPLSTLSLGTRPARLFAMSDTAWLSDYQSRLEREPDVRKRLPVIANDLVIVRGDRAYVHHPERLRRGLDTGDPAILHYEPQTVRWTQTLEAVLKLAAAELPLHELQAVLTARLGMRPDVASALTERLLEIGCLVFSRPIGSDALRDLGVSLAETNARAASGIAALSQRFVELEAEPACAVTRERLVECDRSAATLHRPGTSPLQVNVIASFAGTLGERVLADVAEIATLLVANARPRKLSAYRAAFLERYEGDSRRVPLLELTDPDLGIGAPHDPMEAPEEPEPARDGLRLQLIARALRDRTPEVSVDEKQLRLLHNFHERTAAPTNGFEIGFQIAAKHVGAIDSGDYLIRPVYGINTDGLYKTVHRFERKLATGIAALHRAAEHPEDAGAPLPAELIFTPYDAHYANLLQVPAHGHVVASRRERLPKHLFRIEPRDIVIGLEGLRFVAYSLSLQRRLLVRESYMLQVPYFGPPHIRLLSMIGKQDHVMPQLLGWGTLGAMPFTPRVRHGRLVLAVARWTLSRQELESRRDDLPRFIGEWRREWNVPRWIYLVERDLKLLLDLESPVAAALICDQLGTRGDGYPVGARIAFEEMFPDFEQLWLEKDGERHFHEFVAGIAAEETAVAVVPAPHFGARTDIKHGPGSAWTFAKIYCPAAEMDIVLRSVASLVSPEPSCRRSLVLLTVCRPATTHPASTPLGIERRGRFVRRDVATARIARARHDRAIRNRHVRAGVGTLRRRGGAAVGRDTVRRR